MIDQMTCAVVTRDAVTSERPGERGFTVEGVLVDGHPIGPVSTTDALADLIAAQLAVQQSTRTLLSVDRASIAFGLLEGCDGSPADVLSDGEGRFFDVDSLRPVDIHGRRISLEHAKHNARNHARRARARSSKAA